MQPRRILLALWAVLAASSLLRGAETVCSLFRDFAAAHGRQVILTGDLIISAKLGVLGAADCDEEYTTDSGGIGHVWPVALRLRLSPGLPAEQRERFATAAREADRLRAAGEIVEASATMAGRVRVDPDGDLPGELTVDSIESLAVAARPDPRKLPVIPICELFQDLQAWKGKRIAVRGESADTREGAWIAGSCPGRFYTGKHRWPVLLTRGVPAYFSTETEPLIPRTRATGPAKGEDQLRGRSSLVRSATYVGVLRMREQYDVACSNGFYFGSGYGHMNAAAAELIVEAEFDQEVSARPSAKDADGESEPACQPADLRERCAEAATLEDAAGLGCLQRVRDLLKQDGIDSREGGESPALLVAIRRGFEEVVRLLIAGGAPVNPARFSDRTPLHEAASARRYSIMKLLRDAGAEADVRKSGESYLATFGFFDLRSLRFLLEAGADPNGRDRQGATALMHAAAYGYEDQVKLLLQHKADIHLTDNAGRNALMHAASGTYIDAIAVLLEKGADPYAKDRDGRTALDLARKSKNAAATELLSAAIK